MGAEGCRKGCWAGILWRRMCVRLSISQFGVTAVLIRCIVGMHLVEGVSACEGFGAITWRSSGTSFHSCPKLHWPALPVTD